MPFSSSWESVAQRVRRNPRAASRVARNWLSSYFSTESESDYVPVNRSVRSERTTPQNSRYFLRSSRRQA